MVVTVAQIAGDPGYREPILHATFDAFRLTPPGD